MSVFIHNHTIKNSIRSPLQAAMRHEEEIARMTRICKKLQLPLKVFRTQFKQLIAQLIFLVSNILVLGYEELIAVHTSARWDILVVSKDSNRLFRPIGRDKSYVLTSSYLGDQARNQRATMVATFAIAVATIVVSGLSIKEPFPNTLYFVLDYS